MIDSLKIDGLSDDNVEQIGSSDLSQSLPELKPKTTVGSDSEAPSISEPETPPVTGDFVMKVQLEPHETNLLEILGGIKFLISQLQSATPVKFALSVTVCLT